MDNQYSQNESHDLLGEAAESYVRYIFATEGFEVYGDSKWGADCAALDRDKCRWYRIEIRSTDKIKGRPRKKPARKLKGKIDLIAEVIFSDCCVNVCFIVPDSNGSYNQKSRRELLSVVKYGHRRFMIDGSDIKSFMRKIGSVVD